MKNKAIIVIGIIIAIGMMGMILLNVYPREHIPEHWPSIEKMEKKLTSKHYEVTVSDVIEINGITLEGERIRAAKGKNFVEAFWYKNASDIDIIDQYCSDTYGAASYHRVGNTLYFGTEKALKEAGVDIVKVEIN